MKAYASGGSKFYSLRVALCKKEGNYFHVKVISLGGVSIFHKLLVVLVINPFPASGDFCHLLITFANSLGPDHTQQNIGPDLDPNCLTL